MINGQSPISPIVGYLSNAKNVLSTGISVAKDKIDSFQADRIKTKDMKLLQTRYPARILNFNQYRGQIVVDIGNGSGSLVSILNHYGAYAFGIDPYNSPSINTNKIPIVANANQLISADGRMLPFRENSVDTMFSNHSIFSFRKPVTLDETNNPAALKKDTQALSNRVPSIQEVERVLKPGGKIYAAPVNKNNINLLLREAGTTSLTITDFGTVTKHPVGGEGFIAPGENPSVERKHWVEITKT